MRLNINGESRELAVNDLTGVLSALKLNPEIVVVEKNGEIILRGSNCLLADGDTLEIVRFVGGG